MSTAMATQSEDFLRDIQQRLNQRSKRFGFALQAVTCKADGDWRIVVVTPASPDVRAYDYNEVLSEVEHELGQEGIERVLLLPTLDD